MQEKTSETFQQLWRDAVENHGDRTFLVFSEPGGTASWTYREFDQLVTQTADHMAALGLSSGDAVHLVLKNSPAFVLIWLAASSLGAWIVPADPASTARDIAAQIRRAQPKLGFYAESRKDVYLAGATEQLQQAVALTESIADTLPGSALLAPPSDVDTPNTLERPVVAPSDRLAVMFTSGTTSEPKGVVLTQQNYFRLAHSMADIIALAPHHRWLVTLPMFHANAQFYCFSPAIATGASVALTSAFSASGWFTQAAELKATHASLFAAPIRMILARRPEDAPRLQLEHVWFAQSLGQDHYGEFADYAGCLPRQIYGMTETTAIVTGDFGATPRADIIGTPIPGRRLELLDPATGRPVAQGEPGVMTVQGEPGVDLFEGYLNDPSTTARSFFVRDGETWFSTGDLARADDHGNLSFVGRVDDVIKVSGENVSLTEIEVVISQAPGVLEAAVLAIPDPLRDQVPVAYVVARDPKNPPIPEQLAEWAELNLPPRSRPREWTIIDELPRTSVGKIRRFQLKAPPSAETKAPE